MSTFYKRKHLRWRGHDYSEPGAYFVTVCTQDRQCLFSLVVNGEMRLNPWGDVVKEEWLRTSVLRPNVELDEFVVMPNHFHAIFALRKTVRRGVLQYAPTLPDVPVPISQMRFRSPSQTIGAVVRGFKSATTKQINALRKTPFLPVWQRNYYERVIRSEQELIRIRQYIHENPLKWDLDPENPNRKEEQCVEGEK